MRSQCQADDKIDKKQDHRSKSQEPKTRPSQNERYSDFPPKPKAPAFETNVKRHACNIKNQPPLSPLDRNALPRSRRTNTQFLFALGGARTLALALGKARAAMQVAFLDGAAALEAD